MRGAGLGVIGLDYQALNLVAGWSGIEVTPRLFGKIQLLEMEWVSYLNARKEDRDTGSETEDEDDA